MLQIHALGPLSVDGLATRRRLALVAGEKRLALFLYLLLNGRGGVIRRDLLLPLLWPEADEGHARSALRSLVWEVRTAVGDGVVASEGDHALGIDVTRVRCDVLEFEAACDNGEWERAVELYRGQLLEGFGVPGAAGFEEWLESERARLAARALDACRALATEARGRGAQDTAVRALRKALTISPYDERVVQKLMEVLAEAGDRAGALVAYEEFVARLKAELEVEPGAETVAVAEGVRAQRPDLDRADRIVPSGTEASSSGHPVEQGRRRFFEVGVYGVPILLGVMALSWLWTTSRRDSSMMLPRLAVLPFEDRSANADPYFADGVTEAITTRLSVLSGLEVIASNSAMQFQGTQKSHREIGEELGVPYLLRGTIQRENHDDEVRVLVSTQLIRVADARVQWADSYERPLRTMFELQAAIAARVAESLDIALTGREEEEIRSIPTLSVEAWDYYTQGLHFFHQGSTAEVNRRAAETLKRAVAIDTSFALAYGLLSQALGPIGDTAGQRAAAARALELDPGLPEARLALATMHYVRKEWDTVVEVAAGVLADRPNHPQAQYLVAATQRRQGKYEESLEGFRRCVALDPLSSYYVSILADMLSYMGHHDEAERYVKQLISLAPEQASRHMMKARIALMRDGDLETYQRALRETASLLGMPEVLSRLVTAHAYVPKMELLDSALHVTFLQTPRVLIAAAAWQYYWARATVHSLRNEGHLSATYYDSLRMEMERLAAQDSSDVAHAQSYGWNGVLGIAYAGLGRPAEAVAQGQKGVALLPISVDGWDGLDYVEWLARIYMMIGDYGRAIEQLMIYAPLFPGEIDHLRINPFYDPLRSYPRFQALLASRPER